MSNIADTIKNDLITAINSDKLVTMKTWMPRWRPPWQCCS